MNDSCFRFRVAPSQNRKVFLLDACSAYDSEIVVGEIIGDLVNDLVVVLQAHPEVECFGSSVCFKRVPKFEVLLFVFLFCFVFYFLLTPRFVVLLIHALISSISLFTFLLLLWLFRFFPF